MMTPTVLVVPLYAGTLSVRCSAASGFGLVEGAS